MNNSPINVFSKKKLLLNLELIKPLIYALALNNNFWLFGSIPTQIVAFPLLLIINFSRKISFLPILILLIFQICSISIVFLGLSEYVKYTVFVSCYILFSYEVIFKDKNTKNIIFALIILTVFFIFVPDSSLLFPKIFLEYASVGGIPRVSGFCQNPNETAAIFFLPVIIDSIKKEKGADNFTYIFSIIGIITTGSRGFLATLIVLWVNKTLKFRNIRNLTSLLALCFGTVYYVINYVNETILKYKTNDLVANNRWDHFSKYINQHLTHFNIYKDGNVEILGNIHNQFLALIPRFGFLGFMLSISLLVLIAFSILYPIKKLDIYLSINYICLILPLLVFDFTMAPYFYSALMLLLINKRIIFNKNKYAKMLF